MGKAFQRHATSCVTTHDSYFQLPGLPSLLYIPSFLLYVTSVISPVFLYNRLFHESDISFYSILFSPFSSIFFPFLWIPGLRFLCPSSIFPLFPLHFPDVYACARLPNARVNIIMCMPFLCSSYIREKYVLQHPYDSTLQRVFSKIIQKKSDLSLEYI